MHDPRNAVVRTTQLCALIGCIVVAAVLAVAAEAHALSAADYTPRTVWTSYGKVVSTMAEEDGTVYAYNPVASYFATDGKEGYDPDDVPHTGYQLEDVRGAIHDVDWTTDYSQQVIQSMAAMEKVDAFWRDEVGIQGIDGNNGLYKLVVLPEELDGGARCQSAKHGDHIYSYSILLGLTPDGNTIGSYPEILCHEYTHGILSNVVQYTNGYGEHGALNEAIADIFAAAYLKDPSWHLAAGLARYDFDKDIKAENRTMKDYDYDTEWSSGITSWLYKHYYSMMGKPDTRGINKQGNSYIVSHTVYKIWKGAYGRDFSMLVDTMRTALPVIPSDADFSDFREAFTAAARHLYGADMAKKVERYFDKAGIRDGGAIVINESSGFDSGGNHNVGEEGSSTSVPQATVEDYRSALSGSGNSFYAMVDLNGDGSDELLATSTVYEGGRAETVSVYTIKDGVPVCAISWLHSTFDYLKYDMGSNSIVTTGSAAAGASEWITCYLDGAEGRVAHLVSILDEDGYGRRYQEVVDDYGNRISYTDLDVDAFDAELDEWQARDARATYITFGPLPF